jgi:hypothetical protein
LLVFTEERIGAGVGFTHDQPWYPVAP